MQTLNRPTSTTPQIEVATLFTRTNGIILELEQYSENLRYFNCSLLSCYGNEDERLFFGYVSCSVSLVPFLISIRTNNKKHTEVFMKCLYGVFVKLKMAKI